MVKITREQIKTLGFGCDNCAMLKGKHCKLWQVKVDDARNESCESGQHMTYDVNR